MRHFKLPLLVTGVALLALIVGTVIVTSIHRSKSSGARKLERAQMAGGAVAVITVVVIAPFWLIAAARVGRERRQARDGRSRRGTGLRR
jgi:Na+/H+-translocating membrane pyrophosphatase